MTTTAENARISRLEPDAATQGQQPSPEVGQAPVNARNRRLESTPLDSYRRTVLVSLVVGKYVCRECKAQVRSYALLKKHAQQIHAGRWKAIQVWLGTPVDPAEEFTHYREAAKPETFSPDISALEALKRAAVARRGS